MCVNVAFGIRVDVAEGEANKVLILTGVLEAGFVVAVLAIKVAVLVVVLTIDVAVLVGHFGFFVAVGGTGV